MSSWVNTRAPLSPVARAVSAVLAGSYAPSLVAQTKASGLEEIIVTARKREESLLSIPQEIQAIGQQQIEQANLKTVDDISRFVDFDGARTVIWARGQTRGSSELRKELRIADRVVGSSPSPAFVEELGQSGRFAAYYSELQRANEGIALLGERIDSLIAESHEWRLLHRRWLIALTVLLVLVLLILVYVGAKGGLL